jgi:enoyl-CoA hydratase/carnithine racemase
MTSTLRFEIDGNVGSITITDPPNNRLDAAFNKEFREALHRVAESDMRVLVIRSEGENFCAGGDAIEFAKWDRQVFRTFVNEVSASFRVLQSLRIPTIASVQGMAMGGGIELALACDFLVVEESTKFFAVEIMGGMMPLAGGVQRLAERIGRACTIRMVMLAEPISGAQAAAWGIATHAAPTGELQQATTDLALKLSNGPTRAYAAIKGIIKAWSPGVAAADLLLPDFAADLYESEDVATAMKEVATSVGSFQSGNPLPSITFTGK